MKNKKLDPLEENKVEGTSSKTGGKKRALAPSAKKRPITEPKPPPAEPDPVDPPTTDSIPEAEPLPPAPRAKPEQKPVPMVPEKPAPPSDLPESASGKYEVLEDKKVSIRGHITSTPKGTVIQLAHYGRKVMANMVKQGLKLKGLD